MISVKIEGSFGNLGTAEFSALEGGHAYALTRAISHLMLQMGPAIRKDHELHDRGDKPPASPFGTHQ